MAVVMQPTSPTRFRDVVARAAPRYPVLVVATALGGVALAVLVGRDGSPAWQIARVAGVVVLTSAALAAGARCGARAWGRMTVVAGAGLLAVGVGFLPYASKDGLSVESVAGSLAAVLGLVLASAGTLVATRGRRTIRRVGAGVGTVAVVAIVAFVVGPAVAATNVPRPSPGATPASKGLTYEAVELVTADGVRLAAWYVPSSNRAALVVLHGAGSTRSDVLDEAAVLARHGFGVLLVDARGHGDSAGRAMDFGWHGDADIAAATDYLAGRRDVDRRRIGVVGISMGGEEALGATAANELIRAVVAEGVTARVAADEAWLSDEYGVRGLVQEQLERVQDVVTDALTSAPAPTSLRHAVATSGGTRYLLITAGSRADEGHAAASISAAAPARVDVWDVAGAGHGAGLRTEPEHWEARVIAFLTDSLEPAGDVPG